MSLLCVFLYVVVFLIHFWLHSTFMDRNLESALLMLDLDMLNSKLFDSLYVRNECNITYILFYQLLFWISVNFI